MFCFVKFKVQFIFLALPKINWQTYGEHSYLKPPIPVLWVFHNVWKTNNFWWILWDLLFHNSPLLKRRKYPFYQPGKTFFYLYPNIVQSGKWEDNWSERCSLDHISVLPSTLIGKAPASNDPIHTNYKCSPFHNTMIIFPNTTRVERKYLPFKSTGLKVHSTIFEAISKFRSINKKIRPFWWKLSDLSHILLCKKKYISKLYKKKKYNLELFIYSFRILLAIKAILTSKSYLANIPSGENPQEGGHLPIL